MGCDIHLHLEAKINGRCEHIGNPNVERQYVLFERMAGVRGDKENAIAPPRGLPSDLSVPTAVDALRWGADGHSHSWLSGEEIEELGEWWESASRARDPKGFYSFEHHVVGYLFGNGWNVKKYPSDYPPGVTDARAVFWFDN